ncbi:MAG: RNA polymerase sigma factor [Ruminococcaceae bacterium]|nr:RNA polymerase sigma factor [Oscillospiraceae bacterium]
MDKAAFRTLAETHRSMVYRIALNFFRNIQDAEDATQEVLLKLYLRADPFDSQEHARNWLIQVTLNHCRSVWRSPWRQRVTLEELTAAIPFSRPEDGELFRTVMALPEKHRTVLYLFYYEDLSVREIANVLKVSETAVTSRLSRARKALKDEWTEVLNDGI